MKITEYPKASTLADDDVLLVDGDLGTRNIQAKEAIMRMIGLLSPKEFIGDLDLSKLESGGSANLSPDDRLLVGAEGGNKSIPFSEAFYDLVDDLIVWHGSAVNEQTTIQGDHPDPAWLKRMIWRGKYIGDYVSDKQYKAIADGSYRDIFLGDYWRINGYVWRVVDFEYWLKTAPSSVDVPHIVVMPDSNLINGIGMNGSGTTVGGYVSSRMRTETIPSLIVPMVTSAFESSHLLAHGEWLINAVSNGYPSAGAWYNSCAIEIPNEIMISGCYIWTPACTGSITPSRFTAARAQLAAMKVSPWMMNAARKNFWLRDVSSASNFVASDYAGGLINTYAASTDPGVRPVFSLIG